MNKGLAQPRAGSQGKDFCVFTKDKKIQSRALEIVEYYREHITYTFGQALCKCMEQTHITVAPLSAKTGISERDIGRMRRDEAKDISFRTIIALCIALNLALETAEKLLNLKRFTLNCDESYVQICKLFLAVNVSVEDCNEILTVHGMEPLTDGEILAS